MAGKKKNWDMFLSNCIAGQIWFQVNHILFLRICQSLLLTSGHHSTNTTTRRTGNCTTGNKRLSFIQANSLLKIPVINQPLWVEFVLLKIYLECWQICTGRYTYAVGLLLSSRGSFPSPEPHISLTTDSQRTERKQNGKAWCTAGTP